MGQEPPNHGGGINKTIPKKHIGKMVGTEINHREISHTTNSIQMGITTGNRTQTIKATPTQIEETTEIILNTHMHRLMNAIIQINIRVTIEEAQHIHTIDMKHSGTTEKKIQGLF